MKKALILAIGCSLEPWNKMHQTSLDTWESVEVEGVETVFYFGNPVKDNTDKAIYFPIEEDYYTMGEKMLQAFSWALANKEFDYIARVNSSCYVDKKRLIDYVQTLPETNVMAGSIIKAGNDEGQYPHDWLWGGAQFVISKDVIQKLVDNRKLYNHRVMEDVGISQLACDLKIPFMIGKSCSIDLIPTIDLMTPNAPKAEIPNKTFQEYRLVGGGMDGGFGFEFIDFKECNKTGQHFYRVKYDPDRSVDKFIMEQLFLNLDK